MGKYAKILLVSIGFLVISQAVFAADPVDEFGTRFGGQSPAALGGTPTTQDRIMAFEAQQLQNIEAAAGDEKPQQQQTAQAEPFGPPVPAFLRKEPAEPQTP